MTRTPDKLFRDRLESLQTTPPPAAWDRIAAGVQQRKRRKGGWVIGSLAFLLLLCIGAFLLPDNRRPVEQPPKQDLPITPSPAMAQASDGELKTDNIQLDSQAASEVIVHTNAIGSKIAVPQKKETPFPKKSTADDLALVASPAMAVAEASPETSAKPAFIETDITMEPTGIAAVQTETTASTYKKITYSAADVNARFKRKPKPAAIDTSNKVPSTFQQVLDVAYEFKYENTMLGDLRQIKDELFSSNGRGPARDK